MLTDIARMLLGAAILLACQVGGDWLATRLAWPLPGPVLGMAILAVTLAIRGRTPQGLGKVAAWLLKAMPLFFIPAGVGIAAKPDVMAGAVGGAVARGLVSLTHRRRALSSIQARASMSLSVGR